MAVKTLQQLRADITNESQKIPNKEKQIQQGIDGFKSRLRAMYL